MGDIFRILFYYLMKSHYSQTKIMQKLLMQLCFTTLWNYTILKQDHKAKRHKQRFTTLWNYTILKRYKVLLVCQHGFTTLWNYTILKRDLSNPPQADCFTTLWNYTILKHAPRI